MKKCKRCNIEKEHIEFSLSKNSKDGLNNWCKKCNKNYGDNYYLINKERLKSIRKKWMIENKNNFKEYLSRRYLEIDKERLRKYYGNYRCNALNKLGFNKIKAFKGIK